MKQDVAFHPVNIAFFCAISIVFQADGVANLVKKLWLRGRVVVRICCHGARKFVLAARGNVIGYTPNDSTDVRVMYDFLLSFDVARRNLSSLAASIVISVQFGTFS